MPDSGGRGPGPAAAHAPCNPGLAAGEHKLIAVGEPGVDALSPNTDSSSPNAGMEAVEDDNGRFDLLCHQITSTPDRIPTTAESSRLSTPPQTIPGSQGTIRFQLFTTRYVPGGKPSSE